MLGLQELVHRIDAVEPANAAFLVSTGFNLGMQCTVHVDPDSASFNLPRQSLGASEIGAPDTRSKTEPARVCALKGLGVRIE
jgi:hypothetical protein